MHSAIIYVSMPSNEVEARHSIATFYAGIAKIEQDKSAIRLGDFVFQVDFRKHPAALARLVYVCEQQALSYGILPLDADPQWIMGGPTKKMPGW